MVVWANIHRSHFGSRHVGPFLHPSRRRNGRRAGAGAEGTGMVLAFSCEKPKPHRSWCCSLPALDKHTHTRTHTHARTHARPHMYAYPDPYTCTYLYLGRGGNEGGNGGIIHQPPGFIPPSPLTSHPTRVPFRSRFGSRPKAFGSRLLV